VIRLLEWIVMVILPAGGAILLTIGVALYFMGRLGLALHLIDPRQKDGRVSEHGRWDVR
jgi:hypothetical protein